MRRSRERLDDLVLGPSRMVAVEDRSHEGAVDRAAGFFLRGTRGSFLARVGERSGYPFGPYHRVEASLA